jgi:hypothetical protein
VAKSPSAASNAPACRLASAAASTRSARLAGSAVSAIARCRPEIDPDRRLAPGAGDARTSAAISSHLALAISSEEFWTFEPDPGSWRPPGASSPWQPPRNRPAPKMIVRPAHAQHRGRTRESHGRDGVVHPRAWVSGTTQEAL